MSARERELCVAFAGKTLVQLEHRVPDSFAVFGNVEKCILDLIDFVKVLMAVREIDADLAEQATAA